MNNDRLSNLEYFLKLDPDDPFNWYAVAMEFKSVDIFKTKYHLDHLLTHFSDYLPTYYQAAELLIEVSENKEAEEILEKGIQLAQDQKDSNTLRELQNLLNNLLYDED